MNDSSSDLGLIFIISLPRSGSTLLQSLIGTHERIRTVSEPWLLLPLMSLLNDENIYTVYNHKGASIGVSELVEQLPGKEQALKIEIRRFVKNIYRCLDKLESESYYFLDKTPRYSIYIDQLIDIFEDAKFIFLWRSPLSVVSSMINTWGDGILNTNTYKIDLYYGMPKMIETYQKHKEQPNVYSIQYEKLVKTTDHEVEKIFDFLEIKSNIRVAGNFKAVDLEGSMGDKKGITQFDGVTTKTLGKWKSTLNTPLRKWWVRRYLNYLGKERMEAIGYDLSQMEKDILEQKNNLRYLWRDAWQLLKTNAGDVINIDILRDRKGKNVRDIFRLK